MKLKCSKEKLLENINIALRAVTPRTSLQILECVVLLVTDHGFKMISNDLEMGIETDYIEAEILETGSIALEAKIFSDIIRRLPEGIVNISVNKNNITTIKRGKAEFKILGTPIDEFPMLPQIEDYQSFEINALVFKNMIRQTIFSVSVVDTKPVLKGELLEIKDGCLRMVAVDGFRVSYVQNVIDTGYSGSFVVPSKTLSEVSKILSNDGENVLTISVSKQYIQIEMVGCKVVSRLLEGEFLKYENFFPTDCTTIFTVDRSDMLQSLERAALISAREAKKNPVKFNIESRNLVISSNTEMGASRDELTISNEGHNLEIAFNPKYLIDVLKVLDQDSIIFSFTTALNPCTIRGVDNDNAKYLILPLRVRY